MHGTRMIRQETKMEWFLLSSDEEDISERDNNMISQRVIEIGDDEYEKEPTFETDNTITNTSTNRISSSFQLSSDDNRKTSGDGLYENIQSNEDNDSTNQDKTMTGTNRKRLTPSEAKKNRGHCHRKGRSLL